MRKRHFFILRMVAALGLGCGVHLHAVGATNEVPATPVPYLSPEEEAKHFVLPDGYSLQLVVSDPIIREPVAAAFDGNGRLYVAEMRGYMQDIDGTDQRARTGRISMHWSSKGDGVYDRHTVFVDRLVLPRMILPLGNSLLVNETDSNDLWLYRDYNGDGVADRKRLVYAGGPRGGNLEHQQSGLMWGLDNWLYTAMTSYRLRLDGTNVLKETIPPNNGQWGISQDDYGKPWFVNAGGELGPVNFQQPILYGTFNINNQFAPGFSEVWPLVGLGDVQGGPARYRPSDKTLNHFTAACGGEIFRGDRLPADLRGDLLFAEPVGRLIRRAKIEVKEGVTYLSNAYDHSEFIRSSDPNFRPVNLVTAPDGTLYIVDMYRGIIQEGNWVREGSYLRKVVQEHQLDKNFGRGRIWRLVHKDFTPGPPPNLRQERASQLVAHLEHPNGWWRDTAQKLLVIRGDKSAVPALVEMARASTNHLARIHALWTLEGLHALEPSLLREKLKDEHPRVRIAAIRASESLYRQGDRSLVPDIAALAKASDPNVAIQVMLTANLLKWPEAPTLIRSAMNASAARGVREIGLQLLQPATPFAATFTPDERKVLEHGRTIYQELCFACHGPDGKGMPLQGGPVGSTLAPPLAGSLTVGGFRDGIIEVLLKGLSGPVHATNYESQMVSMESNDDAWIAAVTSYVRNGFGNHAPLIETNDVARVRAANRRRTQPWTWDELHASLPKPLTNRALWKVTASHRSKTAPLAIDASLRSRYSTSAAQSPGMWYQVELPEAATVAALQLDTTNSPRDFPRGYEVQLSSDAITWEPPIARGHATGPFTEIVFPPARARFIRITLTEAERASYWSIHDLQILGTTVPAEPLAAVKSLQQSRFE